MFGETFSIEITATNPLTFLLRTRAGQAPRICTVAVRDADQRVTPAFTSWLLIAAVPGAGFNFGDAHGDNEPEIAKPIGAAIVGEPIPVEDWRPDHPEFLASVEEINRQVEQVSKTLGEIRYGQVPEGFHQIHPHTGKVRPLQVGRYYDIIVDGVGTTFGSGRLKFTVPPSGAA